VNGRIDAILASEVADNTLCSYPQWNAEKKINSNRGYIFRNKNRNRHCCVGQNSTVLGINVPQLVGDEKRQTYVHRKNSFKPLTKIKSYIHFKIKLFADLNEERFDLRVNDATNQWRRGRLATTHDLY